MSSTIIPFPTQRRARTRQVEKVPAYARKLAASLMWRLNIGDGMELIYLLGDDTEYSNQRAIEGWITRQFDRETVAAMAEPVAEIGNALTLFLNNDKHTMEISS